MNRISSISDWVQCEVKALRDPKRESRTHVAAYVGTLSHALVTGQPLEKKPRLRFDALTPALYQAHVQAQSIAHAAKDLLSEQGWTVIETERTVYGDDDLTGHLDILAYHSDYGDAVIDLKTGRTLGAAWLQVGGYLANYPKSASYGGILHVPRVAIGKDVKGTLEFRGAEALKLEWHYRKERIDDVLGGKQALPTPGLHCKQCVVTDCAVRI